MIMRSAVLKTLAARGRTITNLGERGALLRARKDTDR
jgi:hypothetical protein